MQLINGNETESETENNEKGFETKREIFAKMFRRIRKEFLKAEYADFPHQGSYQKDLESDPERNIPNIEYFFRILMYFSKLNNEKQKHIPFLSHLQLNLLLILSLTAKIEKIELTTNFQKTAYSDDSKNTDPRHEKKDYGMDKKKYQEAVNKFKTDSEVEFPKYWNKYGEPVRQYLFESLGKLADELKVKMENELKVSKLRKAAEERQKTLLPTLEMFPYGFTNLKIIVGGYSVKRMKKPENLGDLFRESQSFINLHYLLSIPGISSETSIISDQLLLEMNDDERKDLFCQSDLLVIGSPVVCYVNRHLVLNKLLLCNAVLKGRAYKLKKELGNNFHDGLKDLLGENALKMFAVLMNTDREQFQTGDYDDGGADKKTILRIWKKVEYLRGIIKTSDAKTENFIDLFRHEKLFSPLRKNYFVWDTAEDLREYAVISPGEHIWSERDKNDVPRHSLISVFGTNKVSTAIGIRELAQSSNLRDFPLGGILQIDKKQNTGIKSVTEAQVTWIENEISFADLSARLAAQESFGKKAASETNLPASFQDFSEDEFKRYRNLADLYLETHRLLHPDDFIETKNKKGNLRKNASSKIGNL